MNTPQERKMDRRFVLSSSSVNSYGFRLLTSGYQLAEFLKTPIGYHNHDAKDGVLLRWVDLAVDGDDVVGTPVINLNHPRAERTISEIENGFINGASVGGIVVLDAVEEDGAVVVTKWYNKECSVVDLPSNRDALVLMDVEGNVINLSDFSNFKPSLKMAKTIELPLSELVEVLSLSDEATADAVLAGIRGLKDEVTAIGALVTAANAALAKVQTELSDERKAVTAGKVKAILDGGLADKKLTVELAGKLGEVYAAIPDKLADLVNAMPAYQSVVDRLKVDGDGLPKELADKSWDELDRGNHLAMLKQSHPDVYATKFKAKFGVEPVK